MHATLRDVKRFAANPLDSSGRYSRSRDSAPVAARRPLYFSAVLPDRDRMIELQDVTKRFGEVAVVRGVSLTVEAGTMLVLLGESGCGKTTTLKMINRLLEPSSGRITVGGQDVQSIDPIALRRKIGYVFQGIGLFPHMSVHDNVAVVPRLLGWRERDTGARVAELLEQVGLPAAFAARYPHELSGGQQQRVGVARALAGRAQVLLMDEPFGAIDPITRDGLQTELKSLQRAMGLTVVLVTHDIHEALILGDRIAVLKDGLVVEQGPPARLLAGARDPYVESLLAVPKRQARAMLAVGEAG
jgi:osmoprotectant transport system ATP-binding protein